MFSHSFHNGYSLVLCLQLIIKAEHTYFLGVCTRGISKVFQTVLSLVNRCINNAGVLSGLKTEIAKQSSQNSIQSGVQNC